MKPLENAAIPPDHLFNVPPVFNVREGGNSDGIQCLTLADQHEMNVGRGVAESAGVGIGVGQSIDLVTIEPSRCAGRPLYRVDPVSGCWVWARQKTLEGYGKFEAHGRQVYAHRWSYARNVGPIPAGLIIDHKCGCKACVNPAHLEPVTDTTNIRRGRATKLSPAKAAEIRALVASGAGLDEVAERFGVRPNAVRHVVKGETWRVGTGPVRVVRPLKPTRREAIGRWERGGRMHGFWRGTERLGFVGLTPRRAKVKVYSYGVGTTDMGKAETLKAARRAVEEAIARVSPALPAARSGGAQC